MEWVIYSNDQFSDSGRTSLGRVTSTYILAGDVHSQARGKFFGCEIRANFGGNESVIKRDVRFVSADAIVLDTTIGVSWSPLRLTGTRYTVTVSVSPGTSGRPISKVRIEYGDCLSSTPCQFVWLTKATGNSWTGFFDFGQELGGNEFLGITPFDSDNRSTGVAPRINQWGVIKT